jgi:hypothetical protein
MGGGLAGGVSELGGSATTGSAEPPPQLAVASTAAERHKENNKGLKRTGIEHPLQKLLPVAS